MTAIGFEGVTARYGDVVALDGLTLAAAAGELLVLVGPSGSGKSTALRVLAGLEQPVAGRVTIGDRDVTTVAPHQRRVAMIFQDYALYPHLTVRGNLAFGLKVRREADIDRRVAAAGERVELTELLDRYPDQLSGGQQQRVAVARAMLREPDVYLMDEPLSSLDPQLRHSTRADLVDLHRRLRTTTLYVTHDQAEAMTMGDRIAVLDAGRLQQVGTPQALYDEPANRFVARFFGSPPMNIVDGGGVLGGTADVEVGVRPEDLHIDPRGVITFTITLVEALGSETLLAGTTQGGDHLMVRAGPRASHRAGDVVRLTPDPARLHLFDAASGQRR
jgi:ABC-type sugar transport system ATPase subunit